MQMPFSQFARKESGRLSSEFHPMIAKFQPCLRPGIGPQKVPENGPETHVFNQKSGSCWGQMLPAKNREAFGNLARDCEFVWIGHVYPKGEFARGVKKLMSELFMCDTKVSDFCMRPTSTGCASVGLEHECMLS